MMAGMDTPTPDSPPLTLREIAAQLPKPEIVCARCDRRERFYADQLVACYGSDKPLLELLRELSTDCVWRDPVPQQNACGAHFAGLERMRL